MCVCVGGANRDTLRYAVATHTLVHRFEHLNPATITVDIVGIDSTVVKKWHPFPFSQPFDYSDFWLITFPTIDIFN